MSHDIRGSGYTYYIVYGEKRIIFHGQSLGVNITLLYC